MLVVVGEISKTVRNSKELKHFLFDCLSSAIYFKFFIYKTCDTIFHFTEKFVAFSLWNCNFGHQDDSALSFDFLVHFPIPFSLQQ